MDPNSSVTCWICHPQDLTDQIAGWALNSILSSEERKRNERYRSLRDRKLHLTARLMIRTLLSRFHGDITPDQWLFDTDLHGKPTVSDRISLPYRLEFNITHTDGLVAVVISTGSPVGIDTERIDRPMDHLGLAGRFFSEIESEQVRSCNESERAELFYRIWTLKEAYVKAIGKGLAHGLDSFWFTPFDLSIRQPKLNIMSIENQAKKERPEDWFSWSGRVGNNSEWMLSIVCQGSTGESPAEIPIRHFSLSDLPAFR